MRRFGVSAYAIGDSLSWPEAYDLVVASLADSSTPLFAVVQGWAFPASIPELLQLAAAAGGSEKVMPWNLAAEKAEKVSDEEIREGVAEIQALIGH